MALTLPLPRISTNVRFPEFAVAIAERLFLTPPKPQDAAAAAVELIDARSSVLEHKGRHISMWRWGSRDAPAVLLAHGWGGNAAQMRPFVFPLLEAGYRVIAYDQPAHGVSEGRLTGLPDFADVMTEVAWHHGEVTAVIGHRALVIHDRDDRMMPWLHGATVARHWPGARLMSTEGLGHRRILADEAVTRAAADFIAGRSAVASPARPAVPYPACLY
jgi:pimeloyl-ACP methyl ester carboxylesterase